MAQENDKIVVASIKQNLNAETMIAAQVLESDQVRIIPDIAISRSDTVFLLIYICAHSMACCCHHPWHSMDHTNSILRVNS